MKNNIIYTLLIIVTITLSCKKTVIEESCVCNYNYADSSTTHPKSDEYQDIIDKYVSKGLPGISLLVRDGNGTWLGAAGYADIEHSIKMKNCHVSKVASVTKTFIGTLVLMLVEEGKIGLDDKISKYIDDKIIKKIENAENCKVRNLLNHTSGIYDVVSDQGFYLEILNNPGKDWYADDLLKYIYRKPAAFELNNGVGYSNSNFLLLSIIIEDATGKNHAELLRERIIDPLGLSDTYYHHHEKLPLKTAQGYFDLYNNGTILNMSNYNTGSGNGYGGIYSTTKDMQIFIEALLREKTLLSDNYLDTMLTFTDEEEGKNRVFGLGIFEDFLERNQGDHAYGHRGRDLAYSADLFYFPYHDVTLSYLVNYGTNGEAELKNTFLEFRDEITDEILSD